MKIDRIETFTFWGEWKNWVFVKVLTDDGLYGWGEASLAGAVKAVEAAVHELGAVLIGQDPGGVERHWMRMYHAWRWRGGSIQTTAQAALDIALWDLEGKRLGVPVYRLLGGPYRERIRAYASHWLIGADTPARVREQVREVKRRGFDAFKWSPFDQQALLAERERGDRAGAGVDGGGARRGRPGDGHLRGVRREALAAHGADRRAGVSPVQARLVRGADPLREPEGDGGASADPAGRRSRRASGC